MGVAEQLRIDSQLEGDRVVVRLDGELDMASAPLLQAALERTEMHTTSALVLDVDELRFMDSTGLRIILWARERCRGRDQKFALTAGSSQVQRLLSVSGVAEQLPIIATADAVLA
jgi:anti-sigma B factor antagonist